MSLYYAFHYNFFVWLIVAAEFFREFSETGESVWRHLQLATVKSLIRLAINDYCSLFVLARAQRI